MPRFLLFSSESCISCGAVKKYLNHTGNINLVELVSYDSDIDSVERYGVTATPCLIIVDEDDNMLETKYGGMKITQEFRKLKTKYFL